MEKTKEQLETELAMREAFRVERIETDKLYAIKLVEQVVFGMVAFILMAVLAAIVGLVVIGSG